MNNGIGIQRKILKLASLVAMFTFTAMAADPAPTPVEVTTAPREPLRQLGRGVSNVITGILEVPFNMYVISKDQGDVAGSTYGLARGVWRFSVREVVGVFETVTCPFGWSPIIEPEFFFEPTRSTDWRVNRPQFLED